MRGAGSYSYQGPDSRWLHLPQFLNHRWKAARFVGCLAAFAQRPLTAGTSTRSAGPVLRRTEMCASGLAIIALLLVHLMPVPSDTAKAPEIRRAAGEGVMRGAFVKAFAGPHTPRRLLNILIFEPLQWSTTDERLGAVAVGRRLGDALGGALTFEWELLYAHHWGTRRFGEVGAAVYARWNAFPWNRYIRTTLAIGIGPSATDQPAHYEPKRGLRSLTLAQFNIELNLYLPHEPRLALLVRIQHRSGMFSLINDVRGGSNFLTIGVRRQFP